MRILLFVLISLAACSMARAEGPTIAKINRFFGLGWGDGYHTGRNDCNGSCGSTGCSPAGENIQAPASPGVPVSAPGATSFHFPGQSTGSKRSEIVNIFPIPQQIFASSPAPQARQTLQASAPRASAPRAIRLPPVVEPTQIATRLPSVTTE